MTFSETDMARLLAITAKRPATVIQHILRNGYVTTEEIETLYGYKHAPRAARDVRELGVNLETFRTHSSEGKPIAAYRFGTPLFLDTPLTNKSLGRTTLAKTLKQALVERYGARCAIYCQPVEERLLQIDHRVPYEIGGEPVEEDIDCYMLLSPSANRSKSWTCEHCPNWNDRAPDMCRHCFWAYPEHHTHVAGKQQRQIVLTFTDDEVAAYERLVERVGLANAADTIKCLIKDMLGESAPH